MAKRQSAQVREILEAIVKESDRGCVLVSSAWLEDRLGIIISAWIRVCGTKNPCNRVPNDELESLIKETVNGALNRARNRVTFCRAIGVIDRGTSDALLSLFNIRNDHFAHFAGVSRLTDIRAKDQLDKFFGFVRVPSPLLKARFPGERVVKKNHSKARREFMNAVMILAIRLLTASTPLEQAIREWNRDPLGLPHIQQ